MRSRVQIRPADLSGCHPNCSPGKTENNGRGTFSFEPHPEFGLFLLPYTEKQRPVFLLCLVVDQARSRVTGHGGGKEVKRVTPGLNTDQRLDRILKGHRLSSHEKDFVGKRPGKNAAVRREPCSSRSLSEALKDD